RRSPVIHTHQHVLAGATVPATLQFGQSGPLQLVVEVVDWFDRVDVLGRSWQETAHLEPVIDYMARGAVADLPHDNEVLYAKSMATGVPVLVHASEVRS